MGKALPEIEAIASAVAAAKKVYAIINRVRFIRKETIQFLANIVLIKMQFLDTSNRYRSNRKNSG